MLRDFISTSKSPSEIFTEVLHRYFATSIQLKRRIVKHTFISSPHPIRTKRVWTRLSSRVIGLSPKFGAVWRLQLKFIVSSGAPGVRRLRLQFIECDNIKKP